MTNEQASGAGADTPLRQQIWQGFGLLRQGHMREAIELSDKLVAANPDDAEVLYLVSEIQVAAGNAEKALAAIDGAVRAAPGQLPLLTKQASILMSMRRRADGLRVAAEAEALAVGNGPALWAVGKFYSDNADPEKAREFLEKAVQAGNTKPDLRHDLAVAQYHTGDFAAAEANLDIYLKHAPLNGTALYLRSTLRQQTESDNHVADLQGRLKVSTLDGAGRAGCMFALAKEYEDMGQSVESFAALSEATAIKRRGLRYELAPELATIDAIRATYSAKVMSESVPGHDEPGAIFIVGMPRTGTTLLERMLGRHSEVASAGELLDFGQALAAATNIRMAADPDKTPVEASLSADFAALGRDYMGSARQAAPGSPVFIDKMPVNYMYCGMIRKALPKAKIIHLVRDPMDSCYAIYKTLFGKAYYFSYQLDELADYYATYHRLMRHWHEVMPGAILDVRYEDLVADPEGQARRILAWCDLDWQDAVLSPSENNKPSTTASAAQVRQPIYTTSVQKWRRYEAGLAPLKARLVAAGVVAD